MPKCSQEFFLLCEFQSILSNLALNGQSIVKTSAFPPTIFIYLHYLHGALFPYKMISKQTEANVVILIRRFLVRRMGENLSKSAELVSFHSVAN